ncbi:MAG: hypothetical protein Q8M66_00680, partial [Actinomycetota bacterium]|nr:hypothetical protein [Actinomycetota bacterium]
MYKTVDAGRIVAYAVITLHRDSAGIQIDRHVARDVGTQHSHAAPLEQPQRIRRGVAVVVGITHAHYRDRGTKGVEHPLIESVTTTVMRDLENVDSAQFFLGDQPPVWPDLGVTVEQCRVTEALYEHDDARIVQVIAPPRGGWPQHNGRESSDTDSRAPRNFHNLCAHQASFCDNPREIC